MSEAVLARMAGFGRALALMVAGVVFLASCAAVYQNHGYVPTDEELALIEVGKDTRETVEATLGRPSSQGLLNDVGWFYVQSRWETRGARAPQEVEDRKSTRLNSSH